ncbi:unnamed protein product [Phytophthora fragariaefolia]|uniref:Unnamed protein product n=1 Tax=Phytophthora fragariaefolia TaxID=1490495 RepID=A0A9W7DCU2_9STRA|nr:unnamed protein product [Phytophthora fragariaefolia]
MAARHQAVSAGGSVSSDQVKWPARDHNKPILVQQDDAKPHVPADDPDIVAAGQPMGGISTCSLSLQTPLT